MPWVFGCACAPWSAPHFSPPGATKSCGGVAGGGWGFGQCRHARRGFLCTQKGSYAYGGYPDLDELFEQQAVERDRTKREALLHRIQQLTIERVMFAPIMDLRGLIGVGPRLAEHTINSIPVHPFPAFEDITLKE